MFFLWVFYINVGLVVSNLFFCSPLGETKVKIAFVIGMFSWWDFFRGSALFPQSKIWLKGLSAVF